MKEWDQKESEMISLENRLDQLDFLEKELDKQEEELKARIQASGDDKLLDFMAELAEMFEERAQLAEKKAMLSLEMEDY